MMVITSDATNFAQSDVDMTALSTVASAPVTSDLNGGMHEEGVAVIANVVVVTTTVISVAKDIHRRLEDVTEVGICHPLKSA